MLYGVQRELLRVPLGARGSGRRDALEAWLRILADRFPGAANRASLRRLSLRVAAERGATIDAARWQRLVAAGTARRLLPQGTTTGGIAWRACRGKHLVAVLRAVNRLRAVEVEAVMVVQCWWRGLVGRRLFVAYKEWNARKDREANAAVEVQRVFRGHKYGREEGAGSALARARDANECCEERRRTVRRREQPAALRWHEQSNGADAQEGTEQRREERCKNGTERRSRARGRGFESRRRAISWTISWMISWTINFSTRLSLASRRVLTRLIVALDEC